MSNKLWLQDEQRIETSEEFKTRIYSDFVNSKNDLENTFGIKVISFAFPFGDFGQNSINFGSGADYFEAAKAVYSMAFYQVWPGKGFSFNYPAKDSFLIKRIDVKSNWSADNLLKILDIAKEKLFLTMTTSAIIMGGLKLGGSRRSVIIQ